MKTRFELTPTNRTKKPSFFKLWFVKVAQKFRRLFEAEEVEVTFKVEGSKIRYTYTKVDEKKVA